MRAGAMMPRPYLSEMAYEAYCQALRVPQPPWETLPMSQRLAWGRAVHAAVLVAFEVPELRPVKTGRPRHVAPGTRQVA